MTWLSLTALKALLRRALPFLRRYWKPIGIVVAIATLFVVACVRENAAEKRGLEAGRAECAAKSQAVIINEIVVANEAATELEQEDAEAEIVYRTITEQVDRLVLSEPIYRDVCLDAGGLRLANAALAGTAPDAAEPDPSLPRSLTPE